MGQLADHITPGRKSMRSVIFRSLFFVLIASTAVVAQPAASRLTMAGLKDEATVRRDGR
jgi:hypothetical protein